MGVDALQVPVRFGPLKVASRGFIAAVRAARVHVHFWVINDAATARSLLERGASGIVSDDLPAIRQPKSCAIPVNACQVRSRRNKLSLPCV
jgi:glycerophosphoryl diester phosphodiesterase